MDAAHLPGAVMVTVAAPLSTIREAVGAVCDPEIPVVTIADLGILRDVTVEDGTIVVWITPTYSGCPAMTQIADDVRSVAAGFGPVRVETVLHPAWTTDWITERGRTALHEFGIAPPQRVGHAGPVACPRCSSTSTTTVSRFGSTACKALLVCDSCREPFDLFKAL